MNNLQRLDKVFSNLGYCSRSQAKQFLREHSITLENRSLQDPSAKVNPALVRINGQELDHPDGILILMNKPAGYVCSHDVSEGPRVYDLLPERWMRRNPLPSTVGRLDKDTTGALLITDNTQLIHKLTSPKHHVEKVYEVEVDKPLSDELVTQFASGTLLLEGEKEPCRPAALAITGETSCEVTLTEGKYHQVKRMFAAFGYKVEKLHRSRFGEYVLGDLREGEYRGIVDC